MWSRIFLISLQAMQSNQMEFGPFNALLKTEFSEHQLIEIKMILCIKCLKLKRYDTTAMTQAINKACIG